MHGSVSCVDRFALFFCTVQEPMYCLTQTPISSSLMC